MGFPESGNYGFLFEQIFCFMFLPVDCTGGTTHGMGTVGQCSVSKQEAMFLCFCLPVDGTDGTKKWHGNGGGNGVFRSRKQGFFLPVDCVGGRQNGTGLIRAM